MARQPYDTIIFDLGGVLIDWNPRHLYQKIFSTETEIDHFLTEICPYSWNLEQDAGKSLAQATEERVALFPEWEVPIRAYYGRWEEMLGGAIMGTVDLLESLLAAKRYKILALTNWSLETYPIPLARHEFLSWFEGVVISGEEKCAKPDPRIYQILFDRYQVDPQKAIFIDDNAHNVEAGKKAGLTSIQFLSPMQLREDLSDLL
ncbi:MAG: HAD family phosphatase [Bacteroidota bacterium]